MFTITFHFLSFLHGKNLVKRPKHPRANQTILRGLCVFSARLGGFAPGRTCSASAIKLKPARRQLLISNAAYEPSFRADWGFAPSLFLMMVSDWRSRSQLTRPLLSEKVVFQPACWVDLVLPLLNNVCMLSSCICPLTRLPTRSSDSCFGPCHCTFQKVFAGTHFCQLLE